MKNFCYSSKHWLSGFSFLDFFSFLLFVCCDFVAVLFVCGLKKKTLSDELRSSSLKEKVFPNCAVFMLM